MHSTQKPPSSQPFTIFKGKRDKINLGHQDRFWLKFLAKQQCAGWARNFALGSFYLPHYASVCSTPCPCLLIVVKGLLLKRGRDYLGLINRINTCSASSDLRCYAQTTSKHKLASDYWGKKPLRSFALQQQWNLLCREWPLWMWTSPVSDVDTN